MNLSFIVALSDCLLIFSFRRAGTRAEENLHKLDQLAFVESEYAKKSYLRYPSNAMR
jgi:hypothetical protein